MLLLVVVEGCFSGGGGREQSRHFPKSVQFYDLLVRVLIRNSEREMMESPREEREGIVCELSERWYRWSHYPDPDNGGITRGIQVTRGPKVRVGPDWRKNRISDDTGGPFRPKAPIFQFQIWADGPALRGFLFFQNYFFPRTIFSVCVYIYISKQEQVKITQKQKEQTTKRKSSSASMSDSTLRSYMMGYCRQILRTEVVRKT